MDNYFETSQNENVNNNFETQEVYVFVVLIFCKTFMHVLSFDMIGFILNVISLLLFNNEEKRC